MDTNGQPISTAASSLAALVIGKCLLPASRLAEYEQSLIAAGFILGEPMEEVFLQVRLPAGWRMRGDGEFDVIVLDPGNVRARILAYEHHGKRHANISWIARYTYEILCEGDSLCCVICDAGREIHRIGNSNVGSQISISENDRMETLAAQARSWLLKRYPRYEDPFAYW